MNRPSPASDSSERPEPEPGAQPPATQVQAAPGARAAGETTADAAAPVVSSATAASAPAQPRNPLHGVTLEAMVTALAGHYGWQGLGERIPVRCFQSDPTVASSLKFLRRTPWAREKVESLYLFMLREKRRSGK